MHAISCYANQIFPFFLVGTVVDVHALEKDELEGLTMSLGDATLLRHLDCSRIDVAAVRFSLHGKLSTGFFAEVDGNPFWGAENARPVSITFSDMLWLFAVEWNHQLKLGAPVDDVQRWSRLASQSRQVDCVHSDTFVEIQLSWWCAPTGWTNLPVSFTGAALHVPRGFAGFWLGLGVSQDTEESFV